MKKLYTLLVLLFAISTANSQIVNIPDANFKYALLNTPCVDTDLEGGFSNFTDADINNDGELQESEAALFERLDLSFTTNITDLTGILSFVNLKQLFCPNNNIQSLNLNNMTNLTVLNCENCNMSSLNINGCTSLSNLNCINNDLTTLDVTDCVNLYILECYNNLLSSLDVSNCPILHSLRCQYNQLSTLDVSNCPLLLGGELTCSYNQLISLNLKSGNASLQAAVFSNNPNLAYICANDNANQIAYLRSRAIQWGIPNCEINSYCSFVPGAIYNTITGEIHYDTNANGCGDSSDPIAEGIRIGISDGVNTGSTFTEYNSGDYSIFVQQPNITLTPYIENPSYYTISPATITINFPTQSEPPYIQDFCITANETHNDLEVLLIPVNSARPGFTSHYKISYRNKGTHLQNGSINLTFNDSVLNFISAIPSNTSQTINLLTWNFSNLQPFEMREIELSFNVNAPTDTPAVNGGDILNYTVTINGAIDETPNDNSFTLNQTVVNSYDPNDKTCLEGTTITPSMVGQYVHYVIRFENTGTFAAQNIVVKDMIDTTRFDIASLIPQSSSHPFVTRISNTNRIEFIFENINLPFDDANNDGYVAFKIKTKSTLGVGSTFSNSASIYFDYNFPIVTDTYTTTVQALGNQDFEFSSVFSLSPVPAKNLLTITAKENIVMTSVSIYNTLGQLVQVNTNPNETIDISSLQSGSYFIKILSDKGSATGKFMKE